MTAVYDVATGLPPIRFIDTLPTASTALLHNQTTQGITTAIPITSISATTAPVS